MGVGAPGQSIRTAVKIIEFAVTLTARLRVNFDAVSFRRAEDPHRNLVPPE